MGRPFINDPKNKGGKEDLVPEKRGIMRKVKKFYGKNLYQSNNNILAVLNSPNINASELNAI